MFAQSGKIYTYDSNGMRTSTQPSQTIKTENGTTKIYNHDANGMRNLQPSQTVIKDNNSNSNSYKIYNNDPKTGIREYQPAYKLELKDPNN
jgi:hypothetical protein